MLSVLYFVFWLFCLFLKVQADPINALKGNLEKRFCPKDKPIKGNINQFRNTKIYHVPDGAFYKRTNPEYCFTNPLEAEKAGFRASFK